MINAFFLGVDKRNVVVVFASGGGFGGNEYWDFIKVEKPNSLPDDIFLDFHSAKYLYIDGELTLNPDYEIYAPLGMYYDIETGLWKYPDSDTEDNT